MKIITGGEGGAITCNSEQAYNLLKYFQSHGVTKSVQDFENHNDEPWYYEQQKLGFNYRLNDLSAALCDSQLKRLSENITKRNMLANHYKKRLKQSKISFQDGNKNSLSSFHLFVCLLDFSKEELSKKNYLSTFQN